MCFVARLGSVTVGSSSASRCWHAGGEPSLAPHAQEPQVTRARRSHCPPQLRETAAVAAATTRFATWTHCERHGPEPAQRQRRCRCRASARRHRLRRRRPPQLHSPPQRLPVPLQLRRQQQHRCRCRCRRLRQRRPAPSASSLWCCSRPRLRRSRPRRRVSAKRAKPRQCSARAQRDRCAQRGAAQRANKQRRQRPSGCDWLRDRLRLRCGGR